MCPNLPKNESGRWYIINTAPSEATSVLCTLALFLDTVNLTVQAPSATNDFNEEAPTIATTEVIKWKRLSDDH